MRSSTRLFVAGIAAIAGLGTLALFRHAPVVPQTLVSDALILCVLAIAAELFRFLLPVSATGAIAYIPYFAAAVVVPAWPSVICVVLVKGSVELWQRRAPIKAVLNISSHAIMELLAIGIYLVLGGVALGSVPDGHNLTHVTRTTGLPALIAFVVALFTNNLIVVVAIAIDGRRPLKTTLEENHRATIGLDLLVAPLIFVFAWVYAEFGAIAAATCWVPILGLRQIQQALLDLEQTNEELLELMVKSLEARDPYTSGHSRRVQQYSTTIARAIGLPDRQVNEIGKAALLHDVGKIYEKYASVLSKQDKLTPEEWAIIRDHPDDGANLISTMTKLRSLVPAVRHHHENWDGTGYPLGLKGESAPLAARIIRFADTIDAMTTERPYRLPLTEAQVRSELVRCRGTQFDPSITDQLLVSPLWPTLFAPTTSESATPSLGIVGITRLRGSQSRRKRVPLGA
jgi:hypothetical protein